MLSNRFCNRGQVLFYRKLKKSPIYTTFLTAIFAKIFDEIFPPSLRANFAPVQCSSATTNKLNKQYFVRTTMRQDFFKIPCTCDIKLSIKKRKQWSNFSVELKSSPILSTSTADFDIRYKFSGSCYYSEEDRSYFTKVDGEQESKNDTWKEYRVLVGPGVRNVDS